MATGNGILAWRRAGALDTAVMRAGLSLRRQSGATWFAVTPGVVLEAGAMRSEARSTRVLVADDHPVYLDGIVAAIERAGDLELVARCCNGTEALQQIRTQAPDVAVLDLRMPGLAANTVLEQLSAAALPCRVLILSMHLGGEEIHTCLSLGAAGYIAKDADRAEICDAIRAVADGRTVLSGEVMSSMAAELQQRHAGGHELLTPRESEILGMLAAGASAPDIAAGLQLSTATIKTHLHNLYVKLEVSDRAAAVAEGMRRGLIR